MIRGDTAESTPQRKRPREEMATLLKGRASDVVPSGVVSSPASSSSCRPPWIEPSNAFHHENEEKIFTNRCETETWQEFPTEPRPENAFENESGYGLGYGKCMGLTVPGAENISAPDAPEIEGNPMLRVSGASPVAKTKLGKESQGGGKVNLSDQMRICRMALLDFELNLIM